MNKLISVENLVNLLPSYIIRDKHYKALANAIAKELYKVYLESNKSIIYACIDNLDDETLDILAIDLNISWYNPDYSIEIKRDLIKNCTKIFKKLGTKFAVETVLGSVFPGTVIKEWFEYDGDPYRFKIIVNTSNVNATPERLKNALAKVKYYKNARSQIDTINFKTDVIFDIYTASALIQGNHYTLTSDINNTYKLHANAINNSAIVDGIHITLN